MNCFRQHHRPMTIAAMKTTTGKTTEEITRSATMLTGGGAEGGGSGGSIGGGAIGGGNGGGTGGSAGTMPTVVADANVKSVIKEQSLMRPTPSLPFYNYVLVSYGIIKCKNVRVFVSDVRHFLVACPASGPSGLDGLGAPAGSPGRAWTAPTSCAVRWLPRHRARGECVPER